MKIANIALSAALITATLLLAGCGHKLVATGGDSTVAIYPDKNTFDRLQSMKQQGGAIGGMIGGMGENLVSKKVDDKTPVKILSSDDKGAEVEILDGLSKGTQGYVAKGNLD
jgi:ABC-type oligopeptide transport system substrate-binding subunit